MRTWQTWVLATAVLTAVSGANPRGAEFYVMPFDVDPVIQVDGDLADWATVPNAIRIDAKEQATWGTKDWHGADDLSGIIRLAWRSTGLLLAAEITDDVFTQPYSGMDIYNGDHVNFWIDLMPGVEPARTSFGKGQFHLVVSPGNLAEGGGNRVAPEVFFYIPENMPHKGCEVAARRTKKGYIVEAYAPFSVMKIGQVKQNQDFNFEVAISDADATPAKQETLMTFAAQKWVYSRARMRPMVLGDGNGRGSLPVRSVPLFPKATIPARKSYTHTFTADAVPDGKEPLLFFKARIHNDRVAGWVARGMLVELNGKPITGDRIANRPMRGTMMRGDNDEYISRDGHFVLWYSPDFDAVEKHPQYRLIDNIKACEFEFRVGGLLKPGENTLVFHNRVVPLREGHRTAIVGDVELRIKPKVDLAVRFKPAPTGEIPTYEPQKEFPRAYSGLSRRGERVEFRVNRESFTLASKFSAPDGRWHTKSNRFYRHSRKVIPHNEWIEVRDTFTNLTDEKVPVMQVHTCDLSNRLKKVWLGGIWLPSGGGRKSDSGNPSATATTSASCIGLVALNDDFKVHVVQAAAESVLELSDRSFVLRPGATYTAEWAVVPVDKPDFWAFINAARRMLDVNFRLNIMFAFMMGPEPVYEWTDKMFKGYIKNKSANLVVQSIYGDSKSRYKGRCPYSTSFAVTSHQYYHDFSKRLKKLFPDGRVKHGIYYHCFIDNYDGNEKRFADARKIDRAGNHINYGGRFTYDKLYVPTLENAFGRETSKNIDIILDQIRADGIFWDEFVTSRGKYVYNMWDGCSADIDPETFKIARLKGHVALLSRDWRAKQVKRIMAHGPLMCSGAPYTRALARFKYHAFCETGSITNCRRMLLWSPIGLGDHITEKTQKDAYRHMLRQMDHGCVYAWYSHRIIATHKTLTEYMYPFTPIELRSGILIGKERILTNRSGYFGWGDPSKFEVHVFDRDGFETDKIKVPTVTRDGKTYAEVRFPEGYSAAIVRAR